MSAILEVTLDPDREYEIVNGQPEEKPMAGAGHGGIEVRLMWRLAKHVEENNLGGVYGPDTTFQIGRNERLPDLSFVSAARIPEDGEPEGKWPFAPDLAIEVVSPNDLWERMNDKIFEYFDAGVQQVWLLSPERRTVAVYDSPVELRVLTEADELTSEKLLPGFRCRVSEIFKSPARG
ncbi:MAG TPA: Uma2 family endonuclease [Blastocatellia bacterium]|nr:Uma2 family endonuclease [Blastocatellia bacterium]